MLNKKAGDLTFFFLLSIVILLSFVIVLITVSNKPTKLARQIGEIQIGLLNTYNKGEQILFYLDLSAKYSVYNALYVLANKGGFADESGCGGYLGYNLLNNKEIHCHPDTIGYFKLLFDEKLAGYLNSYPNEELKIYIYDDYIIKESNDMIKLYGIPKNGIKIDILPKESESLIKGIKLEIPKKEAQSQSQISTVKCPDAPPSELNFIKENNCIGKNCYIRKEVKERLDIASEKTKGIGLKIELSSGWRSVCEQTPLYERYIAGKGPKAARPGQSQHHSGGAIDIGITGAGLYCGEYKTGKRTIKGMQIENIGSLFAYRDINTEEEQMIHNCRMTLKDIMEPAGFYYDSKTDEWWHWEYGTVNWARANNQATKFELVLA